MIFNKKSKVMHLLSSNDHLDDVLINMSNVQWVEISENQAKFYFGSPIIKTCAISDKEKFISHISELIENS